MFRPWNVGVPKVRVGQERDGGYVMLDSTFGATCMIGYGVDVNVAFDNDFVQKFDIPAFIFDHTIETVPIMDSRITFTKEGLGTEDAAPLFTLGTHVSRHVPDGANFILKMDIEGGEWDVLRTADLSRVTQLIVELHDLDKAPLDVIERINQQFYLVHIHGNNYPKQPWVQINRVKRMPVVLECTWVRKDLVTAPSPDFGKFPTALDFRNDDTVPELDLEFWEPCERPVSFVVADPVQTEILGRIVTPEDEIISDPAMAKYPRIFTLKTGDHVPYELIMGLDSLQHIGSYAFSIVSNGIVTTDIRYTTGPGPTAGVQLPIFNSKKF